MNDLKVFGFEGNEVRVFMKGDEPWWIAKDVCAVLGIANVRDAATRLEEDEKDVALTDTPGGKQNLLVVNEPGLYSLILGSRKEEARAFKRWVTHDVLPTIRRTGMYATNELLDNPDLLIAVATQLKEERAARRVLELQAAEDKPKVEFFDAVADSKDAIDIGTAAKVLKVPGVGRNTLFKILRESKILMQNNQPYQEYIDRGYFRVIEQRFQKTDGSTNISIKTLVYQKGLDYIRKTVEAAG